MVDKEIQFLWLRSTRSNRPRQSRHDYRKRIVFPLVGQLMKVGTKRSAINITSQNQRKCKPAHCQLDHVNHPLFRNIFGVSPVPKTSYHRLCRTARQPLQHTFICRLVCLILPAVLRRTDTKTSCCGCEKLG